MKKADIPLMLNGFFVGLLAFGNLDSTEKIVLWILSGLSIVTYGWLTKLEYIKKEKEHESN
jgi:hypothetical protein